MLATQSIVLIVCNLFVLIAIILSMFVLKKESNANKTTSERITTIAKNVLALVLFVIIMALQVYSLNCMVYGDCQAWAWILTAFAALGTLSYLGFFVYLVSTMKKIHTTVQNQIDDIRTLGGSGSETPAITPVSK